MTGPVPGDDLTVGDRYYILASSVAADLPKLVLKHDEGFFVADRRGDFPSLRGSEFGFYVEGTRFLRCLELRVHGQRPLALNAAVSEDTLQLVVDLTTPDVRAGSEVTLLGRTFRLARRLALYGRQLYQGLTVENFTGELHDLVLSWDFAADFCDVFEVRGLTRGRRGDALPPERDDRTVRLSYRGLDGVVRATQLRFDPAPAALDEAAAEYRLPVPPGGRTEITVTISAVVEPSAPADPLAWGEVMLRRRALSERLAHQAATLQTSHEYLNHWLERSRTDLNLGTTNALPASCPPGRGSPQTVRSRSTPTIPHPEAQRQGSRRCRGARSGVLTGGGGRGGGRDR